MTTTDSRTTVTTPAEHLPWCTDGSTCQVFTYPDGMTETFHDRHWPEVGGFAIVASRYSSVYPDGTERVAPVYVYVERLFDASAPPRAELTPATALLLGEQLQEAGRVLAEVEQ